MFRPSGTDTKFIPEANFHPQWTDTDLLALFSVNRRWIDLFLDQLGFSVTCMLPSVVKNVSFGNEFCQ